MTTYMPILKAKPGELEAIGSLSTSVRSATRPLFEICPGDDEQKLLELVIAKLKKYVPNGGVIALDFDAVDALRPTTLGGPSALQDACAQLAAGGILVVPVVRLSDPAPVRRVIGAAAASAAAIAASATPPGHSPSSAGSRPSMAGGEVVLRLGAGYGAPPVHVPGGLLTGLLTELGVKRRQVHLLVDMFDVKNDTEVTTALTAASATIAWAQSLGGWASITVAAGAFPTAISGLPVGTTSDLERFDARLWRRINRAMKDVDYGDYGVGHPSMPSTGGRGPLPNLRYTYGRKWRVWREQKRRPGNESFYDLAAAVTSNTAYKGHRYSWGDEQVSLAAAETRGPGTATQWRAYGTSHHVTLVVDRLATLGEP